MVDELCYNCGRRIPIGEVYRRDVVVSTASSSSVTTYHLPDFKSRTGSTHTSGHQIGRVSLCSSCCKNHDDHIREQREMEDRFSKNLGRAAALVFCAVLLFGCCAFGTLIYSTTNKTREDQPAEASATETTPSSTSLPNKLAQRPKPQPQLKLGTVVLTASQKPLPGVVAFIEIDRANVADWPVKSTKIEMPVLAGSHTVVIRSKYMGKYFKKDFGIFEVAEGQDKFLKIETMEPDPKASW